MIENIKKERKTLFMLDLMRWKRVSETSASLDAKPPGERCLYSTATGGGMGKNTASRVNAEGTGGTGTVGNC
ncbi:MAG TPA: hypothetical protein VNR65_05190 [Geobacterales bacterium]|nr:hypothetical protein [Geobacterales bacterium]